MTSRERLRKVFSPPAEPSKRDTGLRFTDILFGFVIRELFIRLQHWSELPGYVHWHLIAATVLVLGSWIGFRRSLNRTDYELKFFNLPLFRFVLDQAMVLFYFRIATLVPDNPKKAAPPPDQLAHTTAKVLLFIFMLYFVWDLLGVVMGLLNKYPVNSVDKPGVTITAVAFGFSAALYWCMSFGDFGADRAECLFVVATLILFAYRFAKEVRSSWRGPRTQTETASATGVGAVATASAKGRDATATATGETATASATEDG